MIRSFKVDHKISGTNLTVTEWTAAALSKAKLTVVFLIIVIVVDVALAIATGISAFSKHMLKKKSHMRMLVCSGLLACKALNNSVLAFLCSACFPASCHHSHHTALCCCVAQSCVL